MTNAFGLDGVGVFAVVSRTWAMVTKSGVKVRCYENANDSADVAQNGVILGLCKPIYN